MGITTREILFAERPVGEPTLATFELTTRELRDPGEGEILVRNAWLSVDPYMRGRMSTAKSYVAGFELGKALQGGAVGEVVESNAEGFAPGDLVVHDLGWREHAVLKAAYARQLESPVAPPQAYLGVLGMPGHTAYAGLTRVGELGPGMTVFVSAAAGAVGSLVGQAAKKLGAGRVIGSAGGPEKVRHVVDELGFDACIDYKQGDIRGQLKAAAPDGVDLYFDNVGGEHLEVAIGRLNLHARVVICGMISQYNATDLPAGPRNLINLVTTRARMEGLLVSDHADLLPEFLATVGPWVAAGEITYRETIREGLESAPQAFLDLLAGANTGKMLIEL
ncbi:MAG: NADP-dependent oxidoreductase [Solirubrobacteraceae bacterium]|nr:NADP-dependent oxidoreductase [Solirubrobacteraceae bacterium]